MTFCFMLTANAQKKNSQFGFGKVFSKSKQTIEKNEYTEKSIHETWEAIESSKNLFNFLDLSQHNDLEFVYAYLKIIKKGDMIYSKESDFVDALIRLYKQGVHFIYIGEQRCAVFPYTLKQYTFQYEIDSFENFCSIWDKQLKNRTRTDWANLRIQKILEEKDFNKLEIKTNLFWLSGNPEVYHWSKKEFETYYKSIQYLPRTTWIMENYNNCLKRFQSLESDSDLNEVGTFMGYFMAKDYYAKWNNPIMKDDFMKQKTNIIEWYKKAKESERRRSINHLK